MRVLVTGSAGFIGKAVTAEIVRRGWTVQPFDHPNTICDRDAIADATHSCDAVINLAGVLGTTELLAGDRYAVDVNISGALNVFDAAGTKPVVQIATGHRGQLNTYAVTKACAEDLALSRAMWQHQPITVVRAFHVYGPHQKPCPPHGPATVRKIVPSFVCRALTGMPLEIWGDGKQTIDLIHVDDVAACLVDAIDGPYGHVVAAGTGIATTVLQAAQHIIDICGSTSDIVHLPMRAGEPENDHVVAEEPCPYKWGLLSGLAATIPWYRDYLK